MPIIGQTNSNILFRSFWNLAIWRDMIYTFITSFWLGWNYGSLAHLTLSWVHINLHKYLNPCFGGGIYLVYYIGHKMFQSWFSYWNISTIFLNLHNYFNIHICLSFQCHTSISCFGISKFNDKKLLGMC